jgi:hypothetical protein
MAFKMNGWSAFTKEDILPEEKQSIITDEKKKDKDKDRDITKQNLVITPEMYKWQKDAEKQGLKWHQGPGPVDKDGNPIKGQQPLGLL